MGKIDTIEDQEHSNEEDASIKKRSLAKNISNRQLDDVVGPIENIDPQIMKEKKGTRGKIETFEVQEHCNEDVVPKNGGSPRSKYPMGE